MKALVIGIVAVLVLPVALVLMGAAAIVSTVSGGAVQEVCTVSDEAAVEAVVLTDGDPAGEGGLGFELPAPGTPRLASLRNSAATIPDDVKALYLAAAERYHLPWTLLAGIGMEETDHGRNTATSSAGAQGLMQFMPATFARYAVDGDGDGKTIITSDADSIYSAANYLVASGALHGPDGIRGALYTYNHALWYVNDVLYYAAAYTGEDVTANPCVTLDTSANSGTVPLTGTGPASVAVNAALAWIGTPYSWGAGNAHGPTAGICCSPSGHD